jgi:transcriptional regulator
MDTDMDMRVMKRNGELHTIAFDKILNRIKKIGTEANIQINYSALTMKVIDQLYDKIPTTKIDELTAEQCAALSTNHPDYGTLAGRIIVSNHQKNTSGSFWQVVEQLYEFRDTDNNHSPIVSKELYEIVKENARRRLEMMPVESFPVAGSHGTLLPEYAKRHPGVVGGPRHD